MEDIRKEFAIGVPEMEAIITGVLRALDDGLQGRPSSLKMLPTFAPTPTGKETGTFMGIDVGGTNVRVLTLELLPDGIRGDLKSFECIMPKDSKTADEFFGFIAQKIADFVEANGLAAKEIKAGLTFSFAVNQLAINKGLQVAWSKGWDFPETIGKDIVELLETQLRARGVTNVRVIALVNDTVGTFANLAYDDVTCGMGLIFGTGTNGCYVEKTANFAPEKVAGYAGEYMVVNTEWGALDIPELGMNRFDRMIDDVSNNKGDHLFEKMISGIYMGWLARLAIRDLMQKGVVLARHLNHPAFSDTPDDTDCNHAMKFTSRHTGIVEDTSDDLMQVDAVLKSLDITDSTLEERRIVRDVCHVVVRRSAYLAAAATVALYRKMAVYMKERRTVGIDGTVYEKSVPFRRFYLEALDLLQPTDKVICSLSKDGSGLGAVIVSAAVAANA